MTRDDDDFSDIPEASSLGGIFSGPGLNDHNSAPTKLVPPSADEPGGLRIQTRCERCGRPRQITVTFLEMVFIAHKRTPPEWIYDGTRGVMRWALGCPCSDQVKPYPFGVTPSECAQGLNKAISYGYLPQHTAQQYTQHVLSQPVPR